MWEPVEIDVPIDDPMPSSYPECSNFQSEDVDWVTCYCELDDDEWDDDDEGDDDDWDDDDEDDDDDDDE